MTLLETPLQIIGISKHRNQQFSSPTFINYLQGVAIEMIQVESYFTVTHRDLLRNIFGY
jgi:hypothetical protein